MKRIWQPSLELLKWLLSRFVQDTEPVKEKTKKQQENKK